MSKVTTTKTPEFKLELKARHAGESGGLYFLLINGQKVCEYVCWGFSSCSVALLQNFKNYVRDYSGNFTKGNWEVLNEHHDALFKWLATSSPDSWYPKEFLMCLNPIQVINASKMLKHECVKEVDHWINKSHGGSRISLYRISLLKDFK